MSQNRIIELLNEFTKLANNTAAAGTEAVSTTANKSGICTV